MYHNHDFEFVKLPDGTYGLDDLYSRFAPDRLLVQLDTCWAHVAGVDPAAYIRGYGQRCAVVHVKDYIKTGNPRNLYQLIGTEVKVARGRRGVLRVPPRWLRPDHLGTHPAGDSRSRHQVDHRRAG